MASLTHKIFASLKSGGGTTPTSSGGQKDAPPVSTSPTPIPSASPTATWNERFYHVAVQGCCHGELDRIYDACAAHEQQTGKRIDVLICCGDFQAVRTASDMDSMAVPDKFKVMGDFHKYWAPDTAATSTRATTAPYLTIFVGGNHENSDLLAQESYGGFVAPNIYYLGHSGVVTVDQCLRVAGLSGIFKDQDYDRPYPPRPYAANYGSKKGAYHVRRVEVAKLDAYLQAAHALRQSKNDTGKEAIVAPLVDVFVSHDWPVGITAYGDEAQLLRYKPYFRDDIRRNALGNPHTLHLLRAAKPVYWVAAHLHCYFEAAVPPTASTQSVEGISTSPDAPAAAPTKFIALDKCAKGSGFLTFLDLPRRSCGSVAKGGVTATQSCKEAAEKPPHEITIGATRIQRDPLWLEVLVAAHPFVAQNRTTETGSERASVNGRRGATQQAFDVEETVRKLVEHHAVAALSDDAPMTAAALNAATTSTLLEALHLPPALPLQLQPSQEQQQSQHSPYSAPDSHGRHNTPRWADPRVGNHDALREHQRPRTEVSSELPAPSLPPVAPPAPSPVAPSTLSFFEDVATTGPQPSTPSPSSSAAAANTSATPAPLGWFEDTAQ